MSEPRNAVVGETPAWHAIPAEDALRAVKSARGGLDADEVELRRARHGPNALPPPVRRSAWARFLLQFHNALLYVLIGAGLVTLALQHWVDSGVIFGVVIINAVVGFIQEGRAEQALDAIRSMLSPTAMVLRAGRKRSLPAADIVPGDVVMLTAGDKVPADLRLLEVHTLRVEEAALTGESEPVDKSVAPVAAEAVIGDRRSMAYSGTLVTYGQGVGVAVGTGAATEIGRISALLEGVEQITTPLLRKFEQFGRWLTLATLGLMALTFALGTLWRGYGPAETFMAAVAIAVAIIPEGLPPILTITLALGVRRMARRNAIVRRLPAVETLGAVTVICSDKTGTLTHNEMTVVHALSAEHSIEVEGSGYAPHGALLENGAQVDARADAAFLELARAALLCNDAVLVEFDGDWRLEGDPTEGALACFARKAGLDPESEHAAWPRLDEIPFESQYRFMATLHQAGDATRIYAKGAPERILEMCRRERAAQGERVLDAALWRARMDAIAGQGLRVLALAAKDGEPGQRTLDFAHAQDGYCLLGMVGIIDPPREEAITAVESCREAGIRVKMITGDHAATARAVGERLGIGEGRGVLTGIDLEQLSDDELMRRVPHVDVFARASPEHKLRLVRALQANGEIVAMTGDGVNDAPALKRADVGVAMGQKGTEAAKEAAEMVLADDNFASIEHAVEEGRTIYDNLRKALIFILPTNGGEASTLLVAILFGFTLPISPVQILWVNMITAVTLSLALAFEPNEVGVMRRRPRDPAAPMLDRLLIWRIAFVSLLLFGGITLLYLWELGRSGSVETARTVAVNTLVIGEITYLFNCRHLSQSTMSAEGLFGNRVALHMTLLLLAAQVAFTHLGSMQTLFHTQAMDALAWSAVFAFGVVKYLVIEAEKAITRRWMRVGTVAR
ncbi:MAG TPA: cation-transporting P-type ATPase [Burkholderiales bacterium]|nr:cation-transporting P-type ATPase [Burkholderiales bacterium]